MMYSYLFFLLCASFCTFSNEDVGNIQLTIENIEIKKGVMRVSLYNSESTFLQDGKEVLTIVEEVGDADQLHINFPDVPYETYTLAIYHDVNGNNELDTNLFGIPKEPYGFSNNVRSKWGPPKYELAVFQLEQPTLSLEVAVKKWMKH